MRAIPKRQRHCDLERLFRRGLLVDVVRIDVTGALVVPDQGISLAISVIEMTVLGYRRRQTAAARPIAEPPVVVLREVNSK